MGGGRRLMPNVPKEKRLTPEQRLAIETAYTSKQSVRSLSLEYKVSRRLIQFIVDPERYARNVDLYVKRKEKKERQDA